MISYVIDMKGFAFLAMAPMETRKRHFLVIKVMVAKRENECFIKRDDFCKYKLPLKK